MSAMLYHRHDPAPPRQTLVEHTEQTLASATYRSRGRLSSKSLPANLLKNPTWPTWGQYAHLEHQPLDRLVARSLALRQQLPGFFGQIKSGWAPDSNNASGLPSGRRIEDGWNLPVWIQERNSANPDRWSEIHQ